MDKNKMSKKDGKKKYDPSVNLTMAGKGRQKGAKGKFTTLKAAFLKTFEDLQDTKDANLSAFAQKHPRDFYTLVSRMLPTKNEDDSLAKAVRQIIIMRSGVDAPKNG